MNHDTFSLLNILLDGNRWPTYSFDVSKMDSLAEEAYQRNTFDGYLSYVLITNQICEEYARVLVKEGQFTLLLHLVPRGFNWTFPQRQQEASLNKLMFGKVLEILENSIDFRVKSEFVQACRHLTEIRNRLAHQLARHASLGKLQSFALQYKSEYDELVHLFNQGDDEFSWHYAMMIHDTMWDHVIEKELASPDPQHRAKWQDLNKRLGKQRINSPIESLRGRTGFIRNS